MEIKVELCRKRVHETEITKLRWLFMIVQARGEKGIMWRPVAAAKCEHMTNMWETIANGYSYKMKWIPLYSPAAINT